MDIEVDQSIYFNGEPGSASAVKDICTEQTVNANPDPILLYRSKIIQGSGKAIVLAVGKQTLFEQENM